MGPGLRKTPATFMGKQTGRCVARHRYGVIKSKLASVCRLANPVGLPWRQVPYVLPSRQPALQPAALTARSVLRSWLQALQPVASMAQLIGGAGESPLPVAPFFLKSTRRTVCAHRRLGVDRSNLCLSLI